MAYDFVLAALGVVVCHAEYPFVQIAFIAMRRPWSGSRKPPWSCSRPLAYATPPITGPS